MLPEGRTEGSGPEMPSTLVAQSGTRWSLPTEAGWNCKGLDIPRRPRLSNFLLLRAGNSSFVAAEEMVDHDVVVNKQKSKESIN
jgi:hypothetical protein